MAKKLLATVAGIFLMALLLKGQDPIFTAAAPSVMTSGEQFQYVVEGSSRGEVKLGETSDFQWLGGPYSSYSSQQQLINGKLSRRTIASYTYVFRALKEGSFTFPAATIKVGRKSYTTNAVEIVVNSVASASQGNVPAGASGNAGDDAAVGSTGGSEPVYLRVIPSKKEVFVGEQFVTGLKIFTRVNTRPGSGSGDMPYEGFYKTQLDPDASAQQIEIGGEAYVSQVLQRHILIPQKSGRITIPPFESEWMLQQRVQRQGGRSAFDSFFDDPFFNGVQEVPVTLATLPVEILVKPMPTGAPAGFTGAVGNFTMKAELSAPEVEVNEALSLKITLRGTGNLPLLGEPEVNLPPDHDIYDATRSLKTSLLGNKISGSVTFEYPVIARHAGRYRIAPIQFAWFDPQAGSYRTATTEEFSFTVKKGEQEGVTGTVYMPGVSQESVRDLGIDIRDISREPQLFSPLSFSLFGTWWYRWMYPVLLLLALLLLVLIRLVARRNADLTLVRNRKAGKEARTRLKKADRFRKSESSDSFYEEIGKAIWGYLSHKMNIETSNLSRDMIIGEMTRREVQEETRDEILRILEESEFSRFAPSSEKIDMNKLYEDAASLIRKLENSLK